MTSPKSSELLIQLGGIDVGLIRLRNNYSTFELLDSYLELPRRPVLGQVFEESPRGRWGQVLFLPAWFSNVLPEEPMRSYLAGQFNINPQNEFRLLEVLSDDLPGALRAVPVETTFMGEYTNRRAIRRLESQTAEDGKPVVRFSLAGVQYKLSVLWSQNSLTLPGRGRWGDHILKFPAQYHAGVPENEFYMMNLARMIGFEVPDVRLVDGEELGELPADLQRFRGSKVFVVKRYDRVDGRQVHQEDFNQVLGNRPEDKYRGASYERLGWTIRLLCGDDAAREFFRRLLFNLLIGNEDAHLKNWSIYYLDGVTPSLTPMYDLLSTVQYSDLDREFALKLRGKRNASAITIDRLERVASRIGIPRAEAKDIVVEMNSRFEVAWNELLGSYEVPGELRDGVIRHLEVLPFAQGG